MSRPLLWDLFCRVIDNYGDLGVCWRLAADLASRGEPVRLWVDDLSALDWMAPGWRSGTSGIAVAQWTEDVVLPPPGNVVIEAFGCTLPDRFVHAMSARVACGEAAPVWINLEYLSAEPYVERCHGLPSPQLSGPGAGLTKWFIYPGFTPLTGGLLRERGLIDRQRRFDSTAWLRSIGVLPTAHEKRVSLFCYDNPRLPALLDSLTPEPTLLLVTPGFAARQVADLLGPTLTRGSLRAICLPPLAQIDYDHLLWSCDLNFVRGEDSFVRAQWAGRPFIWQIYPQPDNAHAAKLEAFTQRFLLNADEAFRTTVAGWFRQWNSLPVNGMPNTAAPGHNMPLPANEPWRRLCKEWQGQLLGLPDLATTLCRLVADAR